MRARARVWLVMLLTSVTVVVSCGGDDPPGAPTAPSNAGSQTAGGSDSGGDTSTGAASPSGAAASSGGSEAGGHTSSGGQQTAGSSDEGGASGGGDGMAGNAAGMAGDTSMSSAGAGGNGNVPPDLIIATGGPWPDSFTGACASPAGFLSCPQSGSPFFGQDGSYRLNVPTYSTTSSTATDAVTGLTWQLKPTSTTQSQAEAASYCENLSLAGHADWRLPTRLEYVSLLDVGLPSGFAVPPPIPTETTGIHWTSSPSGTSLGGFFVIDDHFGLLTVGTGSTPRLARCVRGPTLAGSLSIGAATVTDTMTRLEWQRSQLEATSFTWQEALAYCETLEYESRADWRLPSIKELVTLVDEAASEAPIVSSDVFGETTKTSFWSSTPAASFSQEKVAFTLETDFGSTPTLKMTELSGARCVRNAD